MSQYPGEEPPGWAAISNAFRRLYGAQEPMHVAPSIGPAVGGAALQGVSAYLHPDGHWHFVGDGLSVPDPAFDVIETPHGKLRFLQLVGLTGASYERMDRSPKERADVVRELSAASPLFITPGAPG